MPFSTNMGVSTKEMNRRITELAAQEGRLNPVKVTWVDPATLKPARRRGKKPRGAGLAGDWFSREHRKRKP